MDIAMIADIIGWVIILSILSGFVWLVWPARENTYTDRDSDFTDGGQG